MGCFPPVQTAQAAEPCKAGSIGPGLKGPGRSLRASTGLPGDLLPRNLRSDPHRSGVPF